MSFLSSEADMLVRAIRDSEYAIESIEAGGLYERVKLCR